MVDHKGTLLESYSREVGLVVRLTDVTNKTDVFVDFPRLGMS